MWNLCQEVRCFRHVTSGTVNHVTKIMSKKKKNADLKAELLCTV